ncbi:MULTISPECIES: tyrosine-type recombinase/integrase [unclassified Streptomyces]|uniref:tyrosine-type recombinase/integrase n=1 Tax=unclassified Streptomyces TaxID=2593676 RepID=UPI00116490DE|nr:MULTISPECIES: tyrosine-type recombinase/integrase [unclassified Streptomyces]NMI60977.1 tyrosine-type recombinase/integrase [Streptomyces sp. RLA2-12]QDN60070.1 tyrosine-type recombinase/integrase [Streptomyces sp. S1D4-20]QDN70149.1 tyrosine-type recombinase/integrase [Streptomyces sp. S1D4-14]
MKSLDVKIWGVRKRPTKRPAFDVRWSVAGNVFSESFRTKALADHYRSKLMRATRDGEEFDGVTGLPDSMAEKTAKLTWYAFALKYLAMKWPHAAPNTRDGINESLTSVTVAMLEDRPGRPSAAMVRQALRNWAFVLPGPEEREVPQEIEDTLHWIAKASRPLNDLADPVTAREVLDSFKIRLDGKAASAETVRRKRRTFVNALHFAVDLGEFRENPLNSVRWQKPKVSSQVDPRVVVNPQQARSLLNAMSYVGGYERARGRRLVGLFACMYFAGLRPAEAVGLAQGDLTLPEQGWGTVLLHRTRPSVGKQWTDSGESHDDRGLKNRPSEDVRQVPIPPSLVVMLREHLDTFGTAEDGRLFYSERGGVVASSTYSRAWQEARLLALPPAAAASPLARRPYDLRHSALSTWLNAGVDPTEVAERAGNSVEVLLGRYAKCLDGRQEVANSKIDGLLREYE